MPAPVLERLRADHAAALLRFELLNRSWFAASIPDRGDAYFTRFEERHAALLAEQEAGLCHFHVLVEDGRVVGRVNLVDVADGGAELGYRIAEEAAGRGLATAAVREVCARAADVYGLTELRAATTEDNRASLTVLTRTGFTPTGPVVLGGRAGIAFVRALDAAATPPTAPA
ncbi:GNAT family N-acetyltransferase [Streptomyces sp. t39]|uniref:GNAT family N-acetyltransferase n=1 Tax=Streptomyces sp. t39 TaxID=1828156 RepID=UPI0011CE04C9|nr:GNAT family N-acetyltransferase [Streptomyces sp. t39]TXS51093.1 N-acetyltransferase [Streptomyces sp. t39]